MTLIINKLLTKKFYFWSKKDVKNLIKDLKSGAYTTEMATSIVEKFINTDDMVKNLDKEL